MTSAPSLQIMSSDINGENVRTILSEDNHIAQPKAIAVFDDSKYPSYKIADFTL